MKKPKVEPYTIESWEAADKALHCYGLLANELLTIEANLGREVSKLRASAAAIAAPRQRDMARIEAGLEVFWDAHKAEVKGKSRKLNFGTIGERTRDAVKLLKGWKLGKAVAALLKSRPAFVRVKHELDKDLVLNTWSALNDSARRALADCGVSVAPSTKFFVEADLEALHPAAPPAAPVEERSPSRS